MTPQQRSSKVRHLRHLLSKYEDTQRTVALNSIRGQSIPSTTQQEMSWLAMMIADLLIKLEGKVP